MVSLILYYRTADDRPIAVEIIDAPNWCDEFNEPPAAADLRILVLPGGAAVPPMRPGWLGVLPPNSEMAWETEALRRWPASPSYRAGGARLADFLAAGGAALTHPASADPRGLTRLAAYAIGRDAIEPLARSRGAALEHWLLRTFGTPERFAEAILLERIADADPAAADGLRSVLAAEVPVEGPYAELAFDREALLLLASPWRFFDAPLDPARTAIADWRRRYGAAYAAHYAEASEEARRLWRTTVRLERRAVTADRLGALLAPLDEPMPCESMPRAPFDMTAVTAERPSVLEPLADAVRNARAALATIPETPDAEAPTTAGIVLGSAHPAAATLALLAQQVETALEHRLHAVAQRLAHRALDARPGDDLRGILDALRASDLDALDRVLDERTALALARAMAHPREDASSCGSDVLARALERVRLALPDPTAADLDSAAGLFREALAAALRESALRAAMVAPVVVARVG